MIAIVNASPLIYLGKVGSLYLLDAIFDRVVTVPSVKDEVLEQTAPEFAALTDAFSNWLNVIDGPRNSFSKALDKMGLHKGEVDVLDLAYKMHGNNQDAIVVVDDLAARDIARALGLRLTGTIGIILRATRNGLLTNADAMLQIKYLVHETPFRLSTSMYSQILAELDE